MGETGNCCPYARRTLSCFVSHTKQSQTMKTLKFTILMGLILSGSAFLSPCWTTTVSLSADRTAQTPSDVALFSSSSSSFPAKTSSDGGSMDRVSVESYNVSMGKSIQPYPLFLHGLCVFFRISTRIQDTSRVSWTIFRVF